jgi:quercetin dioxygenase-like cupin family protein
VTRARYLALGAAMLVACALSFGAGTLAQEMSLEGSTYEGGGGTRLEVLFDGPYRDVGVDVGVITFPPGTNSGEHPHGVTEIFYVLEGRLEHVVNGESTILEPGMLGHVKPPDLVNHITDPDGPPTRALVMWAPGGEAARITSRWRRIE